MKVRACGHQLLAEKQMSKGSDHMTGKYVNVKSEKLSKNATILNLNWKNEYEFMMYFILGDYFLDAIYWKCLKTMTNAVAMNTPSRKLWSLNTTAHQKELGILRKIGDFRSGYEMYKLIPDHKVIPKKQRNYYKLLWSCQKDLGVRMKMLPCAKTEMTWASIRIGTGPPGWLS